MSNKKIYPTSLAISPGSMKASLCTALINRVITIKNISNRDEFYDIRVGKRAVLLDLINSPPEVFVAATGVIERFDYEPRNSGEAKLRARIAAERFFNDLNT